MRSKQLPTTCDVAIVGAGPAGLAAATRLRELGAGSVLVLERESAAGGVPRHCGHPPFGMREFKRVLTGPAYASALVDRARRSDVAIHLHTTVTQVLPGGRLQLSTPDGLHELKARSIILSTGIRETPRAPRLVSGARPLGVLTTGALQSMVYLKHRLPCTNPVIVGTELVSFSALLTCRHGRIKPVAMIESNKQVTARWFNRFLPMVMGVPVHLDCQVTSILGNDRVTGLRISDKTGRARTIRCDGVIFSGQFTPEAALLRSSHLDIDPGSGGPVVDQYGRCSEPPCFAAGNLLRPVETAGWSWHEGRQCAAQVMRYLNGDIPDAQTRLNVVTRSPVIKYTVPQVISLPRQGERTQHIQLRFQRRAKGTLRVRNESEILWSRNIAAQPERRVLIPMEKTADRVSSGDLEIDFSEAP